MIACSATEGELDKAVATLENRHGRDIRFVG
jgi:hypothetical protein